MSNQRTVNQAKVFWRSLAALMLLLALCGVARAEESDENTPPLKLYNDGTKKLREGKLQEAEACLQGAVASQNERVQGPALYNLGETRFCAGAQDLKKGPNHQAASANSKRASEAADGAIQEADKALAGDDVDAMVAAYMRGCGARKELKSAIEAVKIAMETYGAVLAKWRRASGDFKSSSELVPRDTEARTNADLVDQNIAKLVDKQQMMAQMMSGMSKQRSELGKKMAQLKKKLPSDKGDQMKGGQDEDDDDEDGKKPQEPKPGMEEPGPKEGKEMLLTFEEAARLLDMLKLDGNRKLPMGTNDMGKARDRKGRDW